VLCQARAISSTAMKMLVSRRRRQAFQPACSNACDIAFRLAVPR
jgi:hypothetical protein